MYRTMQKALSFLSLAVLFFFFSACGGRSDAPSQKKDFYEEEHVTPSPESLVVFFDSLLNNTEAFIYARNMNDEWPNTDSIMVWNSIRALDDYQSGKTRLFPLELVTEALGKLVFCQWHYDTHGSRPFADIGEEEDGLGSRIFFLNYLEQVARLCPHVDYLTSIHTGDDKAGIFTGFEFSNGHQTTDYWLLYRYGSGYRLKYLSYYDKYDRIWELTDSTGNEYLLCYNGEMGIYEGFLPFRASLFMKDGEDYELVSTINDWLDNREIPCRGKQLDYNPRTMTWTVCDMRGDKKIPSKGFKRLRLTLDGRDSYFSVVD